ncbi:hypothetical protein [Amycolatopsis tolypomycina]|nr:hypothetical protein [Amycolatopsis tolypomycina]
MHQLGGVCPGCGYPALIVRPRHSTFHCLGCGAGGGPAVFLADLPG